ncbi:MAG: hypothetical protein WCI04_06055 [archaeon]
MLFVRKIVEENVGNKEEDTVTELTELVQVKDAIDKLNGETITGVVLERDKDNLMIIGGGKDNKYVVHAEVKGTMYVMANKFPITKPPAEVIVGGKKGTYESKRVMGLSMVLEAAKHFGSRGALAQTFNWESP